MTYSNLTGMLKKCSHLNAKHRLQPIENYICRLVCTITCAHTPVHMNSFPSRMQRTIQLKNVCFHPHKHTITGFSFHYTTYMPSTCIYAQAGRHSGTVFHPSLYPVPPPSLLYLSLPLPYTCQAYSKVTHLNYPAHMHTHMHKEWERECDSEGR